MVNLLWEILGESVQGASHRRSQMIKQDDIHWHPQRGAHDTVMIAVSDGHGSPRCFRSAKGSWFAVKAAIDSLKRFMCDNDTQQNLSGIKRIAEDRLPQDIAMRWRHSVDVDCRVYPFSESETLSLKNIPHFHAYGATIISVCVTPSFIVYLQLGDGDILTVSADGSVERPLPGDSRLFANETTSLCAEKAWTDFRFRFQTIVDTPDMILVATDGYANSFREDTGFMQAARDIWEMIRSEGKDYVQKHLEEWLIETSEGGSGDDITVGIICNAINNGCTKNLFGQQSIIVNGLLSDE